MSLLNVIKRRDVIRDPFRFLISTVNVVVTAALLTSLRTLFYAMNAAVYSDKDGFLRYFVPFLCVNLLIGSVADLFLGFSVSFEKSRMQLRLLNGAGTTQRQFFWYLFSEALFLSVVALAFGCPFGGLLAKSLLAASAQPLPMPELSALLKISFAAPEIFSVLIAAALAAIRYQRPARREKSADKQKKRRSDRSIQKIFGVGGALEYRLTHNDPSRVNLFQSVLAIELALLLLLTGVYSELKHWRYNDDTSDIVFSGDAPGFQEPMLLAVDDVLEAHARNGNITSIQRSKHTDSHYLFLENDAFTEEYLSQTKEDAYACKLYEWIDLGETGRLIYCDTVFVDEATFDRVCTRFDINCADGEGVLLNRIQPPSSSRESYISLLRPNVREATLYNLSMIGANADEDFVYYQDIKKEDFNASSFTRDVLSASSNLKIHIAGFIEDEAAFLDSIEIFALPGEPVLVFPEKEEAALSPLLTDCGMWYSADICANDSASLTAAIMDAADKFEDYDIRNHKFGVGTDIRGTAVRSGAIGSFYYTDYVQLREDFAAFRQRFGAFYSFFLLLTIVLIAADVISIAFMNRKMRRRESAVLYSLGISGRQQRGMHLFEGLTISLRSALFGCLTGFLLLIVAFPFLLRGMLFEYLNEQHVYLAQYADMQQYSSISWTVLYYLNKLLDALGSTGVFCLIAACALFGIFLLTGLFVHRDKVTDLVTVLKDDMGE